MSGLPFLLEIGTEEIPDWMIQPAINHLQSIFEGLLKDNGLAVERLAVDATPRRLVLRAEGLPARQADTEDLVTGPPTAVAFRDGEPTGAALGFARKMGVPVTALATQATPRGEYLCYPRTVAGRETREILASALPELILKIYFPKTMYWTGKGGPRFIRPIRWIVAVLGDQVVPFELAGVEAGRMSAGHRLLGGRQCPVSLNSYEQVLKENFVLVSASERRQKIEQEIGKLLEGTGLRVKPDAGLLDTLVYSTEYPTPILGGFDPEFLALPEEVLVTVMRHHQKYLSVEDANGRLAPHFIAVMNTNADPEGLVRAGNERVLRARFSDARFFWRVDQQKKLADRVEDLAHVTFQAKLGSYLDKTTKIRELVQQLGGSPHAERAALLSKCDLTTEMVKEFTELQGVIGGLYAREQGEPEEVWRAIYEHYQPVSMEDRIPGSRAGQVLGLADKLDTLRRGFRIGLVPSGSRDPFALRRAAQGVVRILVEAGISDPPLEALLDGDQQLIEFFRDRIEYYFREVRGYAYDEARAAMASGYSDLVDLESRMEAIRGVRPTPDFEPVAASFKRIRNILRQAEFEGGGLNPHLLEPGAERELYQAVNHAGGLVSAYRQTKDYRSALLAIASLRPAVDYFFDKVLVNAPDPEIRQNRLSLLHQLLSEFSAIADFSEIVTTQ